MFFGQALDQMGQKCRYLAQNASLDNLAVFGPKILIFMGVRKSFGTNITKNHLDNLSALFFGQFLDQMGQKCQYANTIIFGTLVSGFQWDTFFVLKTLIGEAPIGR